MNKTLVFFVALLLFFIGGMTIFAAWRISQRRDAVQAKSLGAEREYLTAPDTKEPILTEFTLTERSGKKFNSKELDGQVWVASFFWATCPSSCKQQNETIADLQGDFREQGVKFVGITCDPNTDTPQRLAEYAQQFGAHEDDWKFLTGDLLYTRRIGAEIFQLHVDERVHMDRLVVVDKWGNIRGRFKWSDPAELTKLKSQLEELLAESKPPAEFADKLPTIN